MKPIFVQPRSYWSRADIDEMIEFRWVFFMLMVRDIKLRYRQTLLGVLWVFFQPVSTAIVFTVIFGKCLHVATGTIPYPLFAFCGIIPWIVLSQSMNRAGSSLVNEAHLVQKVYFPRVFLPLSGTFGVLFDFLITLTIFFCLTAYYQIPLHAKLLFIPVATAFIFIFASAVNILLSSLSACYRDFKHIIPFFLQLWMYASPIAYPSETVPDRWRWLFYANPLTGMIDLFRWTLIESVPFPLVSAAFSVSVTLVLLVISLIVFRKLERTFVDVI